MYFTELLFKLLNDIIRITNNLPYNSHVSVHYKNLKLLKLEDIINLELAKFSYKYGNNLLPGSIMDILPCSTHGCNTTQGTVIIKTFPNID